MIQPGRIVDDIVLEDTMTVNDLIRQMQAGGGFVAKHLALGIDILESMVRDEACTRFLSFPADIVATGSRGVVKELVKRRMVSALVTTCGTVAHDLARIWKSYYHGSFMLDDTELYHAGINRLGNVLIPNECYGEILEARLQPLFTTLYEERKRDNPENAVTFSGWELIREIGLRLDDDDSILYWAAKNDIPIFIPGITDGAFGSQLWQFWQTHKDFSLNLFEDEEKLSELVFKAQRSGAFMIGGGISKHHTIWWNQFRDGLDYAVYITTAPEWDGSLSGARVHEAISWGKVREDAKQITVEGDATVLMPFMVAALLERLKR